MAQGNVGVAHNPISNMKLASGAAPVVAMLKAGVDVGLGTDGEKENNNLDMFEEMKVSSLLAKFSSLDAAALDAWDICRMATIGGAKALGLDHVTGSLEVGKSADMIAIRCDTPRMTPLIDSGPLMNIHYNLVHAVQGQDVDMTMVAGKVLVDNGQLLEHDIQHFIEQVNQAAPALFTRRQAWLDSAGGGKNALYQP
jgi:5-methylthioadenosine/S-adenosylhomocysteine deaminase